METAERSTNPKRILLLTALALFLPALLGLLWMSHRGYGIQVNDAGTGLEIYAKNRVVSEIKEGYLVLVSKQTVTGPDLSSHTYYQYELFDKPNRVTGGFFEVWSDRLEPNLSEGKAKLTGPKIRLRLGARKVNVLKGDVWFIEPYKGKASP